MGRAADNPELLLQPYELLELMPLLAGLYQEGIDRGLLMQPGNNIGYFGPYEHLWRGSGDDRVYWSGCNAGQNSLGIEADGTIKGCPSLATSTYAGGNVRDLTLEKIWRETDELSFTRTRTADELWGFCRSCYYADVCRAGCTWTADSLLGRAGNNPYCHHRTLELSRKGLRERIVQVERAPGKSFDRGLFALVLETLDGHALPPLKDSSHMAETTPAQADDPFINSIPITGDSLVQIRPARKQRAEEPLKKHQQPATSTRLVLCRRCDRHVMPGAEICPHCGGNVEALAKVYEKRLREARRASRRLLKLLRLS